jgi:Transglycosylase SLT domain
MQWVLAVAILLFPIPALGSTMLDYFVYASQATGVPVQLLSAISMVESNHHLWALNIGGKVVYPRSREEAEQVLSQSPDTVDIGQMQVNYLIWGKRLGLTKTQLLDARTNAWAGAMILRFYLSEYPFWEAIGRYHSADRSRQIGYAWRIYNALTSAEGHH